MRLGAPLPGAKDTFFARNTFSFVCKFVVEDYVSLADDWRYIPYSKYHLGPQQEVSMTIGLTYSRLPCDDGHFPKWYSHLNIIPISEHHFTLEDLTVCIIGRKDGRSHYRTIEPGTFDIASDMPGPTLHIARFCENSFINQYKEFFLHGDDLVLEVRGRIQFWDPYFYRIAELREAGDFARADLVKQMWVFYFYMNPGKDTEVITPHMEGILYFERKDRQAETERRAVEAQYAAIENDANILAMIEAADEIEFDSDDDSTVSAHSVADSLEGIVDLSDDLSALLEEIENDLLAD